MRTTLSTHGGRDAPVRQSAPTWLKHIACISTSRADAGIYGPLLTALGETGSWRVSLLAGGTHFDEAFGATANHIECFDGAVELFEVRHQVCGDSPSQVARSAGQATTEFGRVLGQARPDLVFVLGDRVEMLAAALATTIHGMPIAHLHGGDVTTGAYDDACRNAITKLAHLHFPAIEAHGRRIIEMGEAPWRVHSVGALALDRFVRFRASPVEEVSRAIGLDFSRPTLVLAYYPETLSDVPAARQIEEVIAGLAGWRGNILALGPNADVGHEAVRAALGEFAARRPNTAFKASLSQEMFWSCLTHARMLVGNSSAGILEAASFRLPVVNIGDRQTGRVRAENVIDAPTNRKAIADAVALAETEAFRSQARACVNPYGDGRSAERIVQVLRDCTSREELLRKYVSESRR